MTSLLLVGILLFILMSIILFIIILRCGTLTIPLPWCIPIGRLLSSVASRPNPPVVLCLKQKFMAAVRKIVMKTLTALTKPPLTKVRTRDMKVVIRSTRTTGL